MKQKRQNKSPFILAGVAVLVLVSTMILAENGTLRGLLSSASQKGGDEEVVTAIFPASVAGGQKASAFRDLSALRAVQVPALDIEKGEDDWELISSISDNFAQRIVFVDQNRGYLLTEKNIYRTLDGAHTWFFSWKATNNPPEFFSGLYLGPGNHLMVSGYSNASDASQGFIYSSYDGGIIWNPKSILSNEDWLMDVVGNGSNVISPAMSVVDGVPSVFYGRGSSELRRVEPHPNQDGWFGHQSSFIGTTAHLAGINFCTSNNNGFGWSCRESIDPIFDGSVQFLDNNTGFVAGGMIFPESQGWIYKTTDGGATWGQRLAEPKWPIRHVLPVDNGLIYASGGNAVFIGEQGGGIIVSENGGATWRESFEFGGEFRACAVVPLTKFIRCVGTEMIDGSFTVRVFELKM